MKYPIVIQIFSQIRENGYVYVDKTDFIYQLVGRGSIYFLNPVSYTHLTLPTT